GEACIGEGGVGEIRIRIVRVGEPLFGKVGLSVGLRREDAIGETGVLEGPRGARFRLVGRRRLGARRYRSLRARLDRRLRLVTLSGIGLARLGLRPGLRLRLVARRLLLRREGIWEV